MDQPQPHQPPDGLPSQPPTGLPSQPVAGTPAEPPALERKDWLGAGGSVLAIALSVLGMNKEPVFRAWAVALMLMAGATGITAIVVSRYRRFTTSAAVVLVVASVAILTLAPDPVQPVVAAPPPSATPGPRVAVSQVAVVAPDGGGSMAVIDVTVRNDGDQVAVLTGVELTIDGFGFVPPCQVGGSVDVTGRYAARLPDNPSAGQVVRVTLHQQVEPGAVDRFTITLRAPDQHDGRDTALSTFVYLVHLGVTQDAAGAAADGGAVLLDAGSPLLDNISYFSAARDATASDVGTGGLCGGEAGCVRDQVACWNANRATLLPLLGVPAARSQNGDLAASALVG